MRPRDGDDDEPVGIQSCPIWLQVKCLLTLALKRSYGEMMVSESPAPLVTPITSEASIRKADR